MARLQVLFRLVLEHIGQFPYPVHPLLAVASQESDFDIV